MVTVTEVGLSMPESLSLEIMGTYSAVAGLCQTMMTEGLVSAVAPKSLVSKLFSMKVAKQYFAGDVTGKLGSCLSQ